MVGCPLTCKGPSPYSLKHRSQTDSRVYKNRSLPRFHHLV